MTMTDLYLFIIFKVWLVRLQRAPYLHGYMYSSFSGYCLFLDGASSDPMATATPAHTRENTDNDAEKVKNKQLSKSSSKETHPSSNKDKQSNSLPLN